MKNSKTVDKYLKSLVFQIGVEQYLVKHCKKSVCGCVEFSVNDHLDTYFIDKFIFESKILFHIS